VGVPQGARPRPVGPGHEIHLRPRRAGHPVPRPHEQGQQPQLLRSDRGHQPLRRTAAAALRLLLPGLDQPDPVRQAPVQPNRPSSISTPSAKWSSTSTRMLDNVLDATHWPLERQREEAANKRRVGLGFTGLGDALACCACATTSRKPAPWPPASPNSCATPPTWPRSNWPRSAAPSRCSTPSCTSPAATSPRACRPRSRPKSASTACATRTCCRSRPPAPSRWPSPTTPRTASSRRSPGPTAARSACRRHAQGVRGRGLRLAPLQAPRRRRREAARLLRHRAGNLRQAHKDMVAAVAPYIDTSISKTVNVPADYPYEDFQDLYMSAWKSGLKGLATYRPNSVLGSVLSVEPKQGRSRSKRQAAAGLRLGDANRRLSIKNLPAPGALQPALAGPPEPAGRQPGLDLHDRHAASASSPCSSATSNRKAASLAVRSLGQRPGRAARPRRRRQDPVDGHARQRPRLAGKSSSNPWPRPPATKASKCPSRRTASASACPGVVAAMAQVIRYRVEQLGAFKHEGPTPVLDALFSLQGAEDRHRRHAVLDGRHLQPGHRRRLRPRPQGNHPARRRHPPLLGVALRQLPARPRRPDQAALARHARPRPGLDRHEAAQAARLPEPLGDFMAFVPGSRKQQNYPSTVAYIANLIIHRYAMLGILDESGFPLQQMGILEAPEAAPATVLADPGQAVQRMRQPHDDPQGRLRFLHRLRRGGDLREVGGEVVDVAFQHAAGVVVGCRVNRLR
jgi:ribonucleoside-diphosphate reductase alpha chain